MTSRESVHIKVISSVTPLSNGDLQGEWRFTGRGHGSGEAASSVTPMRPSVLDLRIPSDSAVVLLHRRRRQIDRQWPRAGLRLTRWVSRDVVLQPMGEVFDGSAT